MKCDRFFFSFLCKRLILINENILALFVTNYSAIICHEA